MPAIYRFLAVFGATYLVANLLLALPAVREPFLTTFRELSAKTIEWAFSDAHIETQDAFDASGRADPNTFYLVYGNPATLRAEQERAVQAGLSEYRASTFSFQIFLFQLFAVPFFFLISLFVASPMRMAERLKYGTLAILILLTLLLTKCILLAAFHIASSGIGIYPLSESEQSLVSRLVSMMSMGFSIAFSFVLWLGLGFRNSRFMELFNEIFKEIRR
ncbi:MAG: hypothetical protein JPMHGGIA_01123 [Saprospiraceae bacterium]|jgi:hypothetical protein|nr:hypothetical protein [Saprospiraceae bacterium]